MAALLGLIVQRRRSEPWFAHDGKRAYSLPRACRTCRAHARVFACDERGQASLEYMLTGLVLIAMIGALGALWRYAADGGFAQLLQASASHALGSAGGVADALLF